MRLLAGTLVIALTAGLAACSDPLAVDRNEAPTAEIGDDITQPANLPVFLDGRASYDADGDEVVFHWSIDHAPGASALSSLTDPFFPNHSADAGTTRFQPDVQGVYVIVLRTYDDEYYSDPAYLIVTADEPSDRPVANAGRDQFLGEGETAFLDGGQSIDPMGGVLDYTWRLVERPYNSSLDVSDITDNDKQQASLAADVPGDYTVALTVDNGMAASDPDSARLLFEGSNVAPDANAGGDFDAMDCEFVDLNCSASVDEDGDRLYHWWAVQAVPSGSAVDNDSISNQNSVDPTVFFDVAGEYQLSCSVFDGQAWSRPDTITIDVAERDYNTAPEVDAGPDKVIDHGEFECDVSTSPRWPYPTITDCPKIPAEVVQVGQSVSDAEDDPYVMEWEVIKDSKLRLVGAIDQVTANVQTPAYQAQEVGYYEEVGFVEITATDCTGESTKDEVEVVMQGNAVRR